MEHKKVAVIMGSDSDFPTVSKAIAQLKELEIPYEAHVMSAHRTPDAAMHFAKGAKDAGFGVIIAAAGMAAHLAGVLAASTTLPVIGLPIKSRRPGGAFGHRPDAQRHPGGNGRHRRCKKRGNPGSTDLIAFR